jgi:hypothetical protein
MFYPYTDGAFPSSSQIYLEEIMGANDNIEGIPKVA